MVLYRSSLEAVSEKLTTAVEEIKKGNMEISRLQNDSHQLKDRVSSKNEVIRKQEALVVELRSKLSEVERTSQNNQATAKDSKDEVISLKRELEKSKERLTESANIISTNTEVITWLNREISRYQLSGGIGPLGSESYNFGSPDSVVASDRVGRMSPVLFGKESLKTRDLSGSLAQPATYSKVLASYDYLKKQSGGLKGLEGIDIAAIANKDKDLSSTMIDEGYYAGMYAQNLTGTCIPLPITSG